MAKKRGLLESNKVRILLVFSMLVLIFIPLVNYCMINIVKMSLVNHFSMMSVPDKMSEFNHLMKQLNYIFIAGILISVIGIVIFSLLFSRWITKPIGKIHRHALQVAEGNLHERIDMRGQDEISALARTFNVMTQRLQEAAETNEQEKEKFSLILANMSDGVIATDSAGKIIVFNKRAFEMIQDIHLSQNIQDLFSLNFTELIERLLEDEIYTIEFHRKNHFQEDEYYRIMFSSIIRREIILSGIIAVIQNVTEQQKLDQARREFVANVSHELRTPLTTIKSYTEALSEGAMHDSQLSTRFMGVIRNETERMIRLVSDLLQLSRFDSKRGMIKLTPTLILPMVEEIIDRFSFQLHNKHIEASLNVEDDQLSVDIDRDKIEQVLDNLISNAIKYTQENGKISIHVRTVEQTMLQISIEDTGIGISEKDLVHIFDRFYRVDKARARNMGGTGLGLSIAQEIVTAHKGTIELRSQLNVGTQAIVTIPYSWYLPTKDKEGKLR